MKYIYLVIGRVRYEGQDVLSAHLTRESAHTEAARRGYVDEGLNPRYSKLHYDSYGVEEVEVLP